jgi:hypothetical protein
LRSGWASRLLGIGADGHNGSAPSATPGTWCCSPPDPHATVLRDDAAAARLATVGYFRETWAGKPPWQRL